MPPPAPPLPSRGHGVTSPAVPPPIVAPPISSNATTAISNAHRSPCKACALAKLQAHPSFAKASTENIPFLHRIQGDICGPIKPECGPFKYFMVLVDASTRWSHVALLSTRNAAFAKLLAQIIKLRAHHPDHPIKSIRLDNAGEFTSKAFDDYCISVGIEVEHPVPHVHSQNGLAEAAIQRLQNVARALVMGSQLPVSAWGYAILHAAMLIRFRPVTNQAFSAYQMVTGYEPNISHLRSFGCAVYVPITPPLRIKMGPQRRLGIYVGYDSPTIIRYLEPTTGDLFTARFADCKFDETQFPSLGGDMNAHIPASQRQELIWCAPSDKSLLDPPNSSREIEVRRILDLQKVAESMPDAFTDSAKVTRSHIPVANVPAKLDVPKRTESAVRTISAAGNLPDTGGDAGGGAALRDAVVVGESDPNVTYGSIRAAASASDPTRKRGRPKDSRDKKPRKKRGTKEVQLPLPVVDDANPSHEIVSDYSYVHELSDAYLEDDREPMITPENSEISISSNYACFSVDRASTRINDAYAYSVALEIIHDDEVEPRSVAECQRRADWPKWKDAIQAELDSLNKRQVFGSVELIPRGVKPVGHKWVFVRKRNEKHEVLRYKARLVAQGFSQRPGIDYEETYSPVMDIITFRYLISLVVSEKLNMQLMDVVTAYLYGDLDTDIYMSVPVGIDVPKPEQRKAYAVKLRRSLYGLKQSGRMWYNRLREYLIGRGYENNELCPCVFIRKTKSGFAIIAVYVDDMNVIGTSSEIEETVKFLKSEFEMKDLGKTKFCLGLELEHRATGILVHQSAYTQKMLRRFNMDMCTQLSTPMVVRSLDVNKDPFRPKEDDEEVLGAEYPYLSAIGALLYLAQCTRPDIAFSVNLLARFSSAPTHRHWNGIKHLFRYLKGTLDMGLFYPYGTKRASTVPPHHTDATGGHGGAAVRGGAAAGAGGVEAGIGDASGPPSGPLYGRLPDSKTPNDVLVGFADAGYLSDPHRARSQTGYVFTMGNTAISWRSTKQTLVATSSNHSEIIALHEAVRECIWLRSVIQHVRGSCGLVSTTDAPTCIYEDNAACIEQMKSGFIKGDNTKHISPKFFYNVQQQKFLNIQVNQVSSDANVADLFTKSLNKSMHVKHVKSLGMKRISEL